MSLKCVKLTRSDRAENVECFTLEPQLIVDTSTLYLPMCMCWLPSEKPLIMFSSFGSMFTHHESNLKEIVEPPFFHYLFSPHSLSVLCSISFDFSAQMCLLNAPNISHIDRLACIEMIKDESTRQQPATTRREMMIV